MPELENKIECIEVKKSKFIDAELIKKTNKKQLRKWKNICIYIFKCTILDGSPRGKASGFDPAIRRFDPFTVCIKL